MGACTLLSMKDSNGNPKFCAGDSHICAKMKMGAFVTSNRCCPAYKKDQYDYMLAGEIQKDE